MNTIFKTTQYNDRFNKELNNFIGAKHIQEFNNILKLNNAVISGSTVLKSINADSYHCNDLDIYVNHSTLVQPDEKNLSTDLYHFIITKTNYSSSGTSTASSNGHIDDCYSGLRNLKCVISLYSKSKILSHSSIQIIVCDDYLETIKDFDLKINKNYWDGESISIMHPENVFSKSEKLTLHIKCKLDYYTLERIMKYRSRGYNIELLELLTIIPKSLYKSDDIVKIIYNMFKEYTFEN
jgi:hypothetical protein